ncbi:hypothetical protein [Tsukamurella soli]
MRYGGGAGRVLRWVTLLVLVWLIVGAVAAGQRGYFSHTAQNCASSATVAVTVVAGVLNYVGANPTVAGCNIPQSSR